jgi:hypothetical protein
MTLRFGQTQPVKGAMEEGAMGLLKGFGRGIAGIIVKPSVGAIDLITRTTEGVRNTTMMGDKKVERKRPPRYFATGARLRVVSTFSRSHPSLTPPFVATFLHDSNVIVCLIRQTYSLYEAEGQELLHSLGSFGEYWDHVYWYHEEFDRKRVLLLSDKAVFYIKRKRIEWKTPWSSTSLLGVVVVVKLQEVTCSFCSRHSRYANWPRTKSNPLSIGQKGKFYGHNK